MPEPSSLLAYSKRRGCSPQAVIKAVKSGRLDRSVVMVRGKAKIADMDLADREWSENTSQLNGGARRRATTVSPPVIPAIPKPRESGAPGSHPSRATRPIRRESTPATASSTPAHVGSSDSPSAILPIDEPVYSQDGSISLNEARRLKELQLWRQAQSKADSDDIDLRKKRGELVEAADVRAAVIDKFSVVRTRLLGVPSRCAQQIPELTRDDIELIEALIREALSEISDGSVH